MGWRRLVPFGGLALALLARPSATAAQQASINASAQVSIIALSIAGTQNLDFGTVASGTPVTIDPRTSVSAGRFQINGFPFAQFQLTFTLPAVLQRFPGPATMPVSFGATSGCGRPTNVQATCGYFNPANPFLGRIRLAFPPNNNYFVWVGATVSPGVAQAPGVYQGAITATVAYTGN
jgi:hypothetical protein